MPPSIPVLPSTPTTTRHRPNSNLVLFTTPLTLASLATPTPFSPVLPSTSSSSSFPFTSTSTTSPSTPNPTASPDHPTCAICHDPLGEYHPNISLAQHPLVPEWAVRVEIIASPNGGARLCRHVFGKRCLEAHLNSGTPWGNKCPMCRMVWFESGRGGRKVAGPPWVGADVVRGAEGGEEVGVVGREESGRSHGQGEGESRDVDDGGLSNRGRLRRSAGFLQQVLEAFNVAEGSDEVKMSVEEVERALERLYSRLEGMGSG